MKSQVQHMRRIPQNPVIHDSGSCLQVLNLMRPVRKLKMKAGDPAIFSNHFLSLERRGVKAPVVLGHGSARSKEIAGAISTALKLVDLDVQSDLEKSLIELANHQSTGDLVG